MFNKSARLWLGLIAALAVLSLGIIMQQEPEGGGEDDEQHHRQPLHLKRR